MKYILDHKGKPFNRFFEEISAIPRNSFKEKGISDYLVKFAENRGLWWYRDEIWNVIIKKPASEGYETHPPVMIQGHTDMVCEKNSGSSHNFDTDPLNLYVENGWLRAKDTTLGADCGDGIAYMLAILDDTALKHPPIEAFFSVQEESGIGGPRLVDYTQFTSKRIIATDIIWEGNTYESVSGAIGGDFIKKVTTKEISNPTFKLMVSNCTGGHSALNIGKCPANAIKVSARILYRINKIGKINLLSIEGGSIRNNIAMECNSVFAYDENNIDIIKNIASEVIREIKQEYLYSDPEMIITLIPGENALEALDENSSNSVINLLHVLPSGAYIRNHEYGDAVFASRNMGNIILTNEMLTIGYMFRGTIKSQTNDMMEQTLCLAERFDSVYEEEYRYSGYIAGKDTPLVNIWKEVYKEATGEDLYFLTMHGGTDVGTIIDHLGGSEKIDVIAIGPNAKSVHTTNEALELASFERTYKYLTTILSRL